jgi:hypothetical protein
VFAARHCVFRETQDLNVSYWRQVCAQLNATSQNRALLLDGSEYATFDLASAAPALFSGIVEICWYYHLLST